MVKFLWVLTVLGSLLGGCTYTVTDSWQDERVNKLRVLSVDTSYQLAGAALADNTLTLSLERRCVEQQQVAVEQVAIENREYDTGVAWSTVGTLVAGGAILAVMMGEGDESLVYLGAGMAGAGILSGIVLMFYEFSDGQDERVLSSRREERQVEQSCQQRWPSGAVTLMAPSAGEQFAGYWGNDGQVDVDVSQASAAVWNGEALQLQIEGSKDWIPIALDAAVLTAGRELSGDTLIRLTVTLDDSAGNANGTIEAGEAAALSYSIVNDGSSTARELSLAVSSETRGLDIESPVKLNSVGPNQVLTGSFDITAAEDIATETAVLESTLFSGTTPIATDRARISLIAANDSDRIYIRAEGPEEYAGLLEAGATRVQSVLTETRRYQFVSDSETKARIEKIVEKGGGNIEERQKSAVEAARQENISKVIQLSVTPIMDSQVQLVLTVHNTVSGDRIYIKDAPADTADVFKALQVFDELAQAFLKWERG